MRQPHGDPAAGSRCVSPAPELESGVINAGFVQPDAMVSSLAWADDGAHCAVGARRIGAAQVLER